MVGSSVLKQTGRSARKRLYNRLVQDKAYYVFLLPAVIYLIIFSYYPMYGVQIAFKNYKGYLGIEGSKWVGFLHFENFLNNDGFWRYFSNTLGISIYSLIAGFPLPILLALLLNEVNARFSKVSRTIFYAPHFISTVVLVGMMNIMFSPSVGVVNQLIKAMGGESYYFLGEPAAFQHLYVWSGVWQSTGWGAVIYLAALASVSPELHEAATIDGASRIQRIIHINLPAIAPTIIIMLIMRTGSLVSVGYEKVYLLQNPLNQEVSEVISTYVYKQGVLKPNQSYSTAVGLFNSAINMILLLTTNFISRKFSETSLF